MEVPKAARAKLKWDGITYYDRPDQVLPWLTEAFKLAMAKNPEWSKSGIPLGYIGEEFELPSRPGKGTFRVFGPVSKTSPRPYITWYSPWTNTRWNMYLDTVKVTYKATKPLKNQ